jgi:hypothetical protein
MGYSWKQSRRLGQNRERIPIVELSLFWIAADSIYTA